MKENKEVKRAIKELKKLKLQREELDQKISELENILKEEMTERQTQEMIIDEYKVKYIEVSTNRFDTTSFKKECIDLYNKYIKTSKVMRFTIA